MLRERLVLHRIAERLLERETRERAELGAIVRAEGAPARDGVQARRGGGGEGAGAVGSLRCGRAEGCSRADCLCVIALRWRA